MDILWKFHQNLRWSSWKHLLNWHGMTLWHKAHKRKNKFYLGSTHRELSAKHAKNKKAPACRRPQSFTPPPVHKCPHLDPNLSLFVDVLYGWPLAALALKPESINYPPLNASVWPIPWEALYKYLYTIHHFTSTAFLSTTKQKTNLPLALINLMLNPLKQLKDFGHPIHFPQTSNIASPRAEEDQVSTNSLL